MKKLEAYKQVCTDVQTAKEICNELDNSINKIGTVRPSFNVLVERNSSDKQFVYGLGILMSQETAGIELGFSESELQSFKDKKANLIELRKLVQELRAWDTYWTELRDYKYQLEKILTDEEKFSLLEYPAKPEQKA
jgi:hypothetical protein